MAEKTSLSNSCCDYIE